MRRIVETIKTMLTKNAKNGIMCHKNLPVCYGGLCRGEFRKIMDVKFLANCLIQKFWNTRINGERIKCTRTKISKLLTIVQILSIKCDNQVAFDDIIAEETCGTSIPALSVLRYPYDIWELSADISSSATGFFEENMPIDSEKMENVDESLPELYKSQGDVSDLLRKIINDVFMEFGTFDAYEFGTLINQFKIDICTGGVLSKEKVVSWLANINPQTNNRILLFVLKYTI